MVEDFAIDVRGVPVWERPGRVFERFDELALGEQMTFVTENEPRGLASRIEQQRPSQARVEAVRTAESEWRVTLTRVESERVAPSVASVLRRCSIFAGADEVAQARLVSVARERTLTKGQSICREGDAFPYLAIVWEGVVSISSTNSGRTRTFYEVFPFDVFGEIELFDGGNAIGGATVLSKSARIVLLPVESVRQAGVQNPATLLALASACAQRARALAESLAAQGSQPIIRRLATVLLPYSAPDRGLSAALAPLPSMTQSQLASAAGTVKEVAARAIAELENGGALRRERGHIRFLDRARLLDFARG